MSKNKTIIYPDNAIINEENVIKGDFKNIAEAFVNKYGSASHNEQVTSLIEQDKDKVYAIEPINFAISLRRLYFEEANLNPISQRVIIKFNKFIPNYKERGRKIERARDNFKKAGQEVSLEDLVTNNKEILRTLRLHQGYVGKRHSEVSFGMKYAKKSPKIEIPEFKYDQSESKVGKLARAVTRLFSI